MSPDVLPQDGASQSFVTVTARDANSQPIRNLALRAETRVGGVPVDFGSLSARSIATGSDGKATLVYTAPPKVSGSASLVVDIVHADRQRLRQLLRSQRGDSVGVGRTDSAADNRTGSGIFGSTPLVDNQPILFTACNIVARPCATPGNPIVSYSWDFGDGGHDSGPSVTHDDEAPSTYVVTLTVVDGVGRRQSSSQTITIAPGAQPTADFARHLLTHECESRADRQLQRVGVTSSAGGHDRHLHLGIGDGSPLRETSSPVYQQELCDREHLQRDALRH